MEKSSLVLCASYPKLPQAAKEHQESLFQAGRAKYETFAALTNTGDRKEKGKDIF